MDRVALQYWFSFIIILIAKL